MCNLFNILLLRMVLKNGFFNCLFFWKVEPESKTPCYINFSIADIPSSSSTKTLVLLMLLWPSLSVKLSRQHPYLLPSLSQPVFLVIIIEPTTACQAFNALSSHLAQCVRVWYCLLCCSLLAQRCKHTIQHLLTSINSFTDSTWNLNAAADYVYFVSNFREFY